MDFVKLVGNFASKKFGGVIVSIGCVTYLCHEQTQTVILAGIAAIAMMTTVYVYSVAKWSDKAKPQEKPQG